MFWKHDYSEIRGRNMLGKKLFSVSVSAWASLLSADPESPVSAGMAGWWSLGLLRLQTITTLTSTPELTSGGRLCTVSLVFHHLFSYGIFHPILHTFNNSESIQREINKSCISWYLFVLKRERPPEKWKLIISMNVESYRFHSYKTLTIHFIFR